MFTRFSRTRLQPVPTDPMLPDWAEGFAGPALQEVQTVVGPSGAEAVGGVSVVRRGDDLAGYVEPVIGG